MDKVVFACVHNAGRSQMAAAFFNRLADPTRARAVSAGTQPAERVHPEVQAVMREVGIDLSEAQPQRLTTQLAADACCLITMGCGEACPVVPGVRVEDWRVDDPKGRPSLDIRRIRDEVRARVEAFVLQNGWSDVRSSSSPRAEANARMDSVRFEFARPGEEAEVRHLLTDSGLPDADVAPHLEHFLLARSRDALIGVVGVELLGRAGLLRSLVVEPRFRGFSLGKHLCDRIAAHARQHGVRTLYLLTTTATSFFARRGFVRVERKDVPPAVQATAEFTSLCPTTAVCMARALEE